MAKIKNKMKNGVIIGVLVVTIIIIFNLTLVKESIAGADFVHYPIKDGVVQDGLFIGDEIIIGKPEYTCSDMGKYPAPSPSPECWQSEEGLLYDQETKLSDWLSLSWTTDAYVDEGELEDFDRTDVVQVEFNPDKAITFEAQVSIQTRYGDEAEITLTIDNKIGSQIEVIIEVEERSSFFSVTTEFTQITTTIDEGEQEILILVPVDGLGNHDMEIAIIPVVKYSEGEYKESTSRKELTTAVVSDVIYDGLFDTAVEEDEGGNIIITYLEINEEESLTTQLLTNTKVLSIIGIITVGFIVWFGFIVWRKRK